MAAAARRSTFSTSTKTAGSAIEQPITCGQTTITRREITLSRLIGTKLIFYTPQYLGHYGDPTQRFPAIRKWHKGATDGEFQPIVAPTNVYRAEKQVDSSYGTHFPSVTSAIWLTKILPARALPCRTPGRIFYVSKNSVYVWTTSTGLLGRWIQIKLDALQTAARQRRRAQPGVEGAPVDQFSFLESDDDHLNVLVRSGGSGEQMWGSEFATGDVALLRTSLIISPTAANRQPTPTIASCQRSRTTHSKTASSATICYTAPAAAGANPSIKTLQTFLP